jgi:hypothetical protein
MNEAATTTEIIFRPPSEILTVAAIITIYGKHLFSVGLMLD